MQIGAIVQARMSSQRFPGKMLCKINGKPLLQYLLDSLNNCRALSHIIVATSSDHTDTPIEKYCREFGVICYRGSLFNVAKRYKEILDKFCFDGFIRVCGDSPLLDHRLIDQCIDVFLNGDYHIVTNILKRTYPKGQSIEIIKSDAYHSHYPHMYDKYDLEHVTTYFYKHQEDFKIFNFDSGMEYGNIQLSVDTPKDIEIISAIVKEMCRPHWEYTLEEILSIYHKIR